MIEIYYLPHNAVLPPFICLVSSMEERRYPAPCLDSLDYQDYLDMKETPALVRDMLEHVYCHAMDPRVPYKSISKVYVYGQAPFDSVESSNTWTLPHTNKYIHARLYVLHRSLPVDEKYGPYTLLQLHNMPRLPSFPIYRIVEILDNGYTHLDELDPDY